MFLRSLLMAKSVSRNSSESEKPAKNLKTLIHEHSLFFDNLVDLIPARFYIPVPDSEERPWFHGLSKSAKASYKKESRENIKKSRRDRYNPEKSASTVDLLNKTINDEKKSLNEEKSDSDGDSGSDPEAEVENPRPVDSGDRSFLYEELHLRLHRRIKEARGNRNCREKRRKNEVQKSKNGDEDVKKKENKRAEFDDISYGKVKLGEMEEIGRKKRKFSKQQELENAEKLEDAKKDPENGKMIADKNSWKAAMSRAFGEKVHDDPKALRRSLKKGKKMHQKHAEKWKERIASQNKVRDEKQKIRVKNIRERIEQKKKRRIEKREKKLMRPGFEGRKDGYINE